MIATSPDRDLGSELTLERERDCTRATLRVRAVLDAASVPAMLPLIEELVSFECDEIVVDMSALDSIDSCGVAAIVALFKRTRASGGSMRIVGLHGQPRAILELLGMDGLWR